MLDLLATIIREGRSLQRLRSAITAMERIDRWSLPVDAYSAFRVAQGDALIDLYDRAERVGIKGYEVTEATA